MCSKFEAKSIIKGQTKFFNFLLKKVNIWNGQKKEN